MENQLIITITEKGFTRTLTYKGVTYEEKWSRQKDGSYMNEGLDFETEKTIPDELYDVLDGNEDEISGFFAND